MRARRTLAFLPLLMSGLKSTKEAGSFKSSMENFHLAARSSVAMLGEAWEVNSEVNLAPSCLSCYAGPGGVFE